MDEEQLLRVLVQHTGHTAFRSLQLPAIQATLAGRDSLTILPTGGGKSLTFQLPALAADKITVVVSPLIALARDQMAHCLDAGIDAAVWNSEASEQQRKQVLSELIDEQPGLRLLYTTPESLCRQPTLREYLKARREAHGMGNLLSFAIDEAHCVSEWGHDFRPAYLELSSLKTDFPGLPIAALTASCTAAVKASIVSCLSLRDPLLLQSSFNRPNIAYSVKYKECIQGQTCPDGTDESAVEVQDLVAFVREREGECGIIYARLRQTCEWLASVLGGHDLDVAAYHAGMDSQRRRRVQSDWSEGALAVVVSTVAFGMGIDRADVRWVVHWNAPTSMEGFYQESGRAGRDGQPSLSVMYVSRSDLEDMAKLEKGSRRGATAAVAAFAGEGGCKRKKLLAFFGEHRGPCNTSQEGACDFCCDRAACLARLRAWEDKTQSRAVAALKAAYGMQGRRGSAPSLEGAQQHAPDGDESEASSPAAETGSGGCSAGRVAARADRWGSAASLAQGRGCQPATTARGRGGVPRLAAGLVDITNAATTPAACEAQAGGAAMAASTHQPLQQQQAQQVPVVRGTAPPLLKRRRQLGMGFVAPRFVGSPKQPAPADAAPPPAPVAAAPVLQPQRTAPPVPPQGMAAAPASAAATLAPAALPAAQPQPETAAGAAKRRFTTPQFKPPQFKPPQRA